MRRRAYIKFVSPNKVQITTLYLQKTLNIKHNDYIDLINLKIIPKYIKSKNTPIFNPEITNLTFYAHVSFENGQNYISVYGETENNFCENLGDATYKKPKLFEITLK